MGFDNECILNIQSLAGEYFCPVCRLLVYPNEAIQSQCTHLYCKPCLTYVVSTTRACPYDGYLVTEADSMPLLESNKPLAETINKIAVHCLYHRSGCPWQGPLSECTSHCSGCAFGNSPVVCNRCGIQIVHRQVQEHAQNCSGVQPQAQQAEGAQGVAASGTSAATANQSQSVPQAETTTTQAPTSQAGGAAHDANQQVNSNTPAVAQASVPTPEQWYQQQQQYQQYYQQYPGYDPYQQQYVQYYPSQQQAVQQYLQQPMQAQPSLFPGQNQPQVYVHPQPQTQPQSQAQSQPQLQAQPLPQSQPPDQFLSHSQIHPHPQVQAPMAPQNQSQMQVNSQKQLHTAVQPHSQIPLQTQPAAHGQQLSQPQPYSHAQPHPVQPHPAQHPHIPQNQQPHPQMQYPQPQVQSTSHSQHPQNLPLPQPQPQSQTSSQAQLQHHLLHPQPRSLAQPNQTSNANAQLQTPHPLVQAVSGHHSYTQPHPYQQMPAGAPQHHPIHMPPSSGSHQQPQYLAQMPSQLPQQPSQMRPPQSLAAMPSQQQSTLLLPSHGQVPNVPPVQKQPVYSHAQQPVIQSMQQAVPPQYVQQHQQAYLGQPSGLVMSHHQKGTFIQQQQQPIQSASRPQVPPQSLQQLSGYPPSQQNVALSHGMMSHQPPNNVGRPMMPNQGMHSQPLPQSHGGLVGAAQLRPTQPSSGQISANQNYSSKMNNPLQSSSEQQHAYIQHSVVASKPTLLDKQGDHNSENSAAEGEAGLTSQKAGRKDASGLVATGAETVEMKSILSESDIKLVDDGQKHTAENFQADDSVKDFPEATCNQSTETQTSVTENGSIYPSLKKMKQETAINTLETSSAGISVEIVVEELKDVSDVDPKQSELASFEDKEIQEVREEESEKLQTDAAQAGGLVRPQIRTDKGSEVVPGSASTSSASVQNVPSVGQIVGSERGNMQLHGKGLVRPSHLVPLTDPGRHQPPPTHYGPSPYQQRPDAAVMLQSLPPQRPPQQVQVPGYPPALLRPQVPGPLPHLGWPLTPPAHFQAHLLKHPQGSFHPEAPPGGIAGAASAAPFGRGPSQLVPYQKNFEPHSTAHGHYDQGPVPLPHVGVTKTSLGEHVGGPHPGSFDSPSGMMMRVPPQQRPASRIEAEMIPSQRSSYYERGPFGHPPDVQSNLFKMDGPPGVDSSSALGLRNERFKPMHEEHMTPLPMEPARHAIDRGEFEDLRQLPRPSNSDGGLFLKTGSYTSSSRPFDGGPHVLGIDAAERPLDKGPRGFNYDELGPSRNIGLPRFLPPYHHDDINGRADHTHARIDFIGQVPGFGHRRVDGRSPSREFRGIPPRGFGGFSGAPGKQSGLDGIDGRESRLFGEVSRSFDLSSDSMGNPFHESRYPVFPSCLRRGDFDNLRGQGFGAFPGHGRMGDLAGPGNFPLRARLGEPGFRSSYSQHGYSSDGFYSGDMESFDNPRKRKQARMGWCRICKVDCETVEGLDLHSQTSEHQKMAMGMVLSIKQQNQKKHKSSNDHSSLEEASKSRNAHQDGRGSKH